MSCSANDRPWWAEVVRFDPPAALCEALTVADDASGVALEPGDGAALVALAG